IDDVSETLRRWLLGQMATMATLFLLTWIGLTLIGIPGALVLGFVTGLLTFIPNVGAILAGTLIVLASLGSGFTAIISSFMLYLAVQFLEGNVLVLFGVWGLALALPLIAVIKVVLNHVWPDQTAAAQS
ncbi:MAG: hypothetical protein K0Q64_1437, partial [Nitrobacter vulgaris]|nr:hypothetical protein [Nitrobacter vulgaris]